MDILLLYGYDISQVRGKEGLDSRSTLSDYKKERGESCDTPKDAPAWPPAKNTKRAVHRNYLLINWGYFEALVLFELLALAFLLSMCVADSKTLSISFSSGPRISFPIRSVPHESPRPRRLHSTTHFSSTRDKYCRKWRERSSLSLTPAVSSGAL